MVTDPPRLSRKFLMVQRRTPAGSQPGMLITDPAAPPPVVRMISYDSEGIDEFPITDAADLRKKMRHGRKTTWIDVAGLGDAGLLQEIGEIFGIHRLSLEDVVNVDQRPKVEAHPDHTFIIVQMSDSKLEFVPEQFALFVGANFVLSFQERQGDCFDMVRARLLHPANRIRSEGPDYLAYALIDSVTDSYFPILEHYGEAIEELEDEILQSTDLTHMHGLHAIRRKLMLIRRAVWPLRDVLNTLTREHSHFISPQTQIYFRDCSDHCFQLIDIVDTARELVSSISDMYHSGASVRMNEIMTVLTIIATIFIPLGFIASLYGMNFDPHVSVWNMPELDWRYGYPFSLGLMLATAAGLLVYFWRKGWIFRKSRR